MDVKGEVIIVRVGVFSGRPNPEVTLSGELADELARRARATIGKEPTDPPPPPQLGSYYGFLIQSPAEVVKRLRLPAEFSVYKGVLTEHTGRQQLHWRDVGAVEPFLIEQAFRQGHGDLLQERGIAPIK